MVGKRGFIRRLAVWARARGRCDFMREVVARPERPSLCTLPITALRVTPPSRPAIWLAERPSDHNFFNSSTRSSFQAMPFTPAVAIAAGPAGTRAVRHWPKRATRSGHARSVREREPDRPASDAKTGTGKG